MSDTGVETTVAQRRLAELQQTYPLPAPWRFRDDELLLDRIEISDLTLFMVGVVARVESAQDGQNTALGAACAYDTYPVDRAYFELLERISVIEARRSPTPLSVRALDGTELSQRDSSRVFPKDVSPLRQRLSLSNGVALHTTWPLACAAAVSELVERDRILRAWQGQCATTPIPTDGLTAASRLQGHYSVRGYEFGAEDARSVAGLGPQRHVVGLFLFPSGPDHPLVYGFAASTDTASALVRAQTEALQRLAFLWGEPLPECTPEPAPLPDYHQDYYLYPPHHAHITRWLEGPHVPPPRTAARLANAALYDGERTLFIDLTPAPLRGRLSVAKAVSTHARRLRFGASRAGKPPHPIM